MKHLIALIVVSGSLLAQSQTKQISGDIRGTVTDQNGSPVSGATVYVVAQGLILNDLRPRSVKTDSNGAFDFRGGLELGTYRLYSRKDADGYLDPQDSFYGDAEAKAPEVELTGDHPSATATVKLSPQAAVVAGRIVDANTGVAVKGFLGFEDAKGHGHEVRFDGNYRILVPPGKDLTLMVILDPPVNRSILPVAPLRLEPGQRVYMDIPVSAQ